jgi:RNA polymerase sigma-70 factor (ECF subfamily)
LPSLSKAQNGDPEYHAAVNGKKPVPKQDDGSITRELRRWSLGDRESVGQIFTQLYAELHRVAAGMLRSERTGHTLQPTALVNELYLRLRASAPPDWSGRTHFLVVAANTLRRILIDYARARCAERRGGKESKIPLEFLEVGAACSYDDLLVIDEALCRLEEADPRAARVTELRFFGGLHEAEISNELGISEITVKRDWKFARAWLASYLAPSRIPLSDERTSKITSGPMPA